MKKKLYILEIMRVSSIGCLDVYSPSCSVDVQIFNIVAHGTIMQLLSSIRPQLLKFQIRQLVEIGDDVTFADG